MQFHISCFLKQAPEDATTAVKRHHQNIMIQLYDLGRSLEVINCAYNAFYFFLKHFQLQQPVEIYEILPV